MIKRYRNQRLFYFTLGHLCLSVIFSQFCGASFIQQIFTDRLIECADVVDRRVQASTTRIRTATGATTAGSRRPSSTSTGDAISRANRRGAHAAVATAFRSIAPVSGSIDRVRKPGRPLYARSGARTDADGPRRTVSSRPSLYVFSAGLLLW